MFPSTDYLYSPQRTASQPYRSQPRSFFPPFSTSPSRKKPSSASSSDSSLATIVATPTSAVAHTPLTYHNVVTHDTLEDLLSLPPPIDIPFSSPSTKVDFQAQEPSTAMTTPILPILPTRSASCRRPMSLISQTSSGRRRMSFVSQTSTSSSDTPRRPLSCVPQLPMPSVDTSFGESPLSSPAMVIKQLWEASPILSSRRFPEQNAIGIVLEESQEESSDDDVDHNPDSDSSECTLTPITPGDTSSSTSSSPTMPTSKPPLPSSSGGRASERKAPEVLHPLKQHVDVPQTSTQVFATASALMAAVTSSRNRNIIIGPCTCRTCSVGCVVALLAMTTGRIEDLKEQLLTDGSGKEVVVRKDARQAGPCPPRRLNPSANLVKVLGESSLKLRNLVLDMATVKLRDDACRIAFATGTQFVVALPNVAVAYLRPGEVSRRGGGTELTSGATTTTIDQRSLSAEADKSERIGGAWGNFAWGARSPSLRRRSPTERPGTAASSRDQLLSAPEHPVVTLNSPSGSPPRSPSPLAQSTSPASRTSTPLSQSASPASLSPSSLTQSTSPSSRSPSPGSERNGELTRNTALRAASKVKAARDAHRTADETAAIRSQLVQAQERILQLESERLQLEATVAELRGRLAATENMLETSEDLGREIEEERRRLEGDNFILEMENARLDRLNLKFSSKKSLFGTQ